MATVDIQTIAGEVVTVDEAIMKVFPFIATAVGFVPGGAAVAAAAPLISELLQVVDNAAKAVAAGNTGAAIQDVISEVVSHLTPGQPNSPVLSAPPPNMPRADTP